MKISVMNYNLKRISGLYFSSILLVFVVSCTGGEKATTENDTNESAIENTEAAMPAYGNVVQVTTQQMDFQLPDSIPSGWTTFRYNNESGMTHFMVLERMPMHEGKQMRLENTLQDVAPVFQDVMDLINEGNAEAGFKEFENLPPWFFEVEFTGGVGLTAPGETTQATVYMEPGTYVIECYIKTNGRFHSVDGMVAEVTVTEEKAKGSAPNPDMTITMAEEGMSVEGEPKAGYQTIAVDYQTQKAHENFVGHDVNLVKLETDTDIEELEKWINWVEVEGFGTPAPAKFLGGIQEMPAGKKGYFTVKLTPGRYAWISEVPNAMEKGLLKIFVVPEEDKRVSSK
ncbi:MAG: hypothetical protein ACNS60_17915 [Candidatus Cyclobacteriaceae bacterium M2_1C_046]